MIETQIEEQKPKPAACASVVSPLSAEILRYIEYLAGDIGLAVEECTPYGKGLKVKSNKPEDGYYAFVWRMARFHCGEDSSTPTLCYWDLAQALRDDFGVDVSFYFLDDSRRKVLNLMEGLAHKLLDEIGVSTITAARHWNSVT